MGEALAHPSKLFQPIKWFVMGSLNPSANYMLFSKSDVKYCGIILEGIKDV